MFSEASWYEGACWYGVFLFSTTLHEASHAYAALKLGDPTAYHAGQVSLDPIPHIRREPIGMVVVPILFFLMSGYIIGWASAPYDPDWERRYPRRAGLMAMAGPLANFALMLLAVVLIRIGMATGFFTHLSNDEMDGIATALKTGFPQLAATLLSIFFSLNLLLFVFNLLPLPPLDGSNFPLLFLKHETANRYISYLRHPTFALVGVFIAYKLFPVVYWPIENLVVSIAFKGA